MGVGGERQAPTSSVPRAGLDGYGISRARRNSISEPQLSPNIDFAIPARRLTLAQTNFSGQINVAPTWINVTFADIWRDLPTNRLSAILINFYGKILRYALF